MSRNFRYGYPGLSRRRCRLKPGWIVLIGGLLLLNVYLLVFRGLPGLPASDGQGMSRSPAARRQPAPVVPRRPVRRSGLGELRGVAGVRGYDAGKLMRRATSSLRFDLERAAGVAGLRLLEQWCDHLQGALQPGDSLARALERVGLSAQQSWLLVKSLRGVMNFRNCRPGERFELLRSPLGQVERLVYHKTPLVRYQVERRNGKLVAGRVEESARVEQEALSVTIKGSLYQSMAAAGERPALVLALVDIFAWDIDFYIDPRPGDSVRLLVEKVYVDDSFVRYGRILAAEYAGACGRHRAFWYRGEQARDGYYDERGDSLRKAFLKSPLKFTRISSGFGMRVHPILGFSQRHLGIDLAAPRGTPIWAPADGTVLFAGRRGISGNLIVLRHANGYQTIFAHLNRIARGIRKGVRVSQKQFIGTVGSTGRSTGPHLHYGMKKNGRHVNPFSQKFPPARPVPKQELARFHRTIEPLRQRLERISLPTGQTSAALTATSESEAG